MKIGETNPNDHNNTKHNVGEGTSTASDIDSFVEKLQEHFLNQARELYSESVVDHWLHPRNPFAIDNPNGHAKIKGPCGDTMEVFIQVRGNKIINASFLTDGCITSIASGSMAVEMAIGKNLVDAMAISQDDILQELGGLPEESRHCALLASNTLCEAVRDYLSTDKEPWKKYIGL
jgi:nitrogen fixation NifU-like protein